MTQLTNLKVILTWRHGAYREGDTGLGVACA